MAWLLIVLGTLAVMGSLVAWLIIRGAELLPGTNVCKRCEFDLGGLLTEPRVPTTFVCPECGHSVKGLAGTKNRRARKPYWRAAAALVLLLGLFTAILGVGLRAPSWNQNRWKPLWLLRAELFEAGPQTQSAAANEIASRVASGSITKAQFETIFDAIAKRQLDPTVMWNRSWAELVQSADKTGLVSPLQLATFAKQGISQKIISRRRVRIGTAVPIRIATDSARSLNAASSVSLVRRTKIVHARIDSEPPVVFGFESEGSPWGRSSGWTHFLGPTPRTTGQIRVSVVTHNEIGTKGGEKPLLSWDETLVNDVTCVASDQPILDVVADDSLTQQMQSSIRITKLIRSGPRNRTSMFYVENDGLPVNFVAEVIVRCTRKDGSIDERRIMTLALPAGNRGTFGQSLDSPQDFQCASADIILRPSLSAAEQSTDFDSVWFGPDLVYPKVNITDPQ